jgi:predicted  nucleic acid-binding Zn-ribbon protein
MAEEPDNMVLVMLRRIDTKIDRLTDDVHELKVRMTSVETNLAGVQRRIDRLEDRGVRIERRLDLVSPAGFAEE